MRKGFVSPLFFILILSVGLVGIIGYLKFYKPISLKTLSENLNDLDQSQTSIKPESNDFTFGNLSFSTKSINDPQTNMYFAYDNKLYKVTLDGSSPQIIASFSNPIASVNILRNGDLIVREKNASQEESYVGWRIINDAKQVQINITKGFSGIVNSLTNTRIYTQEDVPGQAEIYAESLDGAKPKKIGVLKQKLITPGCEHDPCPGPQFPAGFPPSFDGSYLITHGKGGGGLGQSAKVVSKDFSKTYDINIFIYNITGIWIDNNKLLISESGRNPKIFTFKENGTFDTSTIGDNLGGDFYQKDLSPSRKLLITHEAGRLIEKQYLYNLESNTKTIIDKLDEKNLGKKYNLSTKEELSIKTDFIGWNQKSDKVFFINTITTFGNTPSRFLGMEIKCYDIKAQETHNFGNLNTSTPNIPNFIIR